VKVGAEDKKKLMWAAGLGGVAVLLVIYQLIPSGSTSVSAPVNVPAPVATATQARPGPTSHRATTGASAKKVYGPASLDPTLHLDKLAATENIKYEGSGRNIFVSQAEAPVVSPLANGTTDHPKEATYTTPSQPPPPPIPLKFFGFASRSGEAKKIFLSQNEDVWVAGEGDIVNRRYKVVRISNNSVEIQDMVVSGPPQSIPLTTQG
jgi:hypothetical protein